MGAILAPSSRETASTLPRCMCVSCCRTEKSRLVAWAAPCPIWHGASCHLGEVHHIDVTLCSLTSPRLFSKQRKPPPEAGSFLPAAFKIVGWLSPLPMRAFHRLCTRGLQQSSFSWGWRGAGWLLFSSSSFSSWVSALQGLSAAGEWEVRLVGTPQKLDVWAASPGLLCLPKWGERMLQVGGSAKRLAQAVG